MKENEEKKTKQLMRLAKKLGFSVQKIAWFTNVWIYVVISQEKYKEMKIKQLERKLAKLKSAS